MQVVYKTHYKKIITSTSTVQITHFLKEEKMCLSNIHVLIFALNHFTPRRNISILNYLFFSILIQCNIGRYKELKKIIIKPGYIVSNQHQIVRPSSDLGVGGQELDLHFFTKTKVMTSYQESGKLSRHQTDKVLFIL